MWPREDGSMEWPLELVGLLNAGPDDDRAFNEVYFNYDYLDEARAMGKGTVHQYAVLIDDPKNADRLPSDRSRVRELVVRDADD